MSELRKCGGSTIMRWYHRDKWSLVRHTHIGDKLILPIKMTIEAASMGVFDNLAPWIRRVGDCRGQKETLAWVNLVLSSNPHSTSALPALRNTLMELKAIHPVPYTLPPTSHSSCNKYGLCFQKSSPTMSQCSSAILVASCLVLWFPCDLDIAIVGDTTPFSDPMAVRFCHVQSQMLKNRHALRSYKRTDDAIDPYEFVLGTS